MAIRRTRDGEVSRNMVGGAANKCATALFCITQQYRGEALHFLQMERWQLPAIATRQWVIPDATPEHFQTTQSGIVGADLNPKVGFPKPEASVFYTEACTMLGPN